MLHGGLKLTSCLAASGAVHLHLGFKVSVFEFGFGHWGLARQRAAPGRKQAGLEKLCHNNSKKKNNKKPQNSTNGTCTVNMAAVAAVGMSLRMLAEVMTRS